MLIITVLQFCWNNILLSQVLSNHCHRLIQTNYITTIYRVGCLIQAYRLVHLSLAEKYSPFLFNELTGMLPLGPVCDPYSRASWILTASVVCLESGSLCVDNTENPKSVIGSTSLSRSGCVSLTWSIIHELPGSRSTPLPAFCTLEQSLLCWMALVCSVREVSPTYRLWTPDWSH